MIRYPRTPHLPWSPGATSDDVRGSTAGFEGHEVVVTEKLDGENTTLYRDHLHARSPDGAHHPSRTRLKVLHAQIADSIPEGVRICGENVAARHSLAYDDLLGWFYAFSVWQDDRALDWDATVAFAHARGLPTPRVLYRGPWDERRLRALRVDTRQREGFVVRTVCGFSRDSFATHVAKWVRPSHVQTDTHWMHRAVEWNQLGPDAVPWSLRSGGPVDPETLGMWIGSRAGATWDPGGLGEARLEGLVASQLIDAPPERLPVLAKAIGVPLAVRAWRLATLQARLTLEVPDDTRAGGLVSLARSADLGLLHGLALHVQPPETHDTIRWSRLHAEDAGLLCRDAIECWCDELKALLPPVPPIRWAWLRGRALTAWSSGTLASPAEAAAWLHPLLERDPVQLTVLAAPSGAGKSTRASALPGRVVSLDALRAHHDDEHAVLTKARADLSEALGQGAAVWDATSLLPSQRQVPLQLGTRHDAFTRIEVLLTPRATCEARNRSRRSPVPDAVIARQWHRVRWPLAHEAHQVDYNLLE